MNALPVAFYVALNAPNVPWLFDFEYFFCSLSICLNRRQGRDRSVAIVMAFVAIFFPTSYPLRLRSDFDTLSFDRTTDSTAYDDDDDDRLYLQSGLPRSLIHALLRDGGRDTFLAWMHRRLRVPPPSPIRTPCGSFSTFLDMTGRMPNPRVRRCKS